MPLFSPDNPNTPKKQCSHTSTNIGRARVVELIFRTCPDCRKRFFGRALSAWYHQGDIYHFINVRVYMDGMIDAWGLTDFDGFVKKIKQKKVVTAVPRGQKIACYPVFQGFATPGFINYILEDEFLKEVLDVMAQFKGRAPSWEKCKIAYKNWEAFRSVEAQQELKTAYLAVPAHLREFILGDTTTKDQPIKTALMKELKEFTKKGEKSDE